MISKRATHVRATHVLPGIMYAVHKELKACVQRSFPKAFTLEFESILKVFYSRASNTIGMQFGVTCYRKGESHGKASPIPTVSVGVNTVSYPGSCHTCAVSCCWLVSLSPVIRRLFLALIVGIIYNVMLRLYTVLRIDYIHLIYINNFATVVNRKQIEVTPIVADR